MMNYETFLIFHFWKLKRHIATIAICQLQTVTGLGVHRSSVCFNYSTPPGIIFKALGSPATPCQSSTSEKVDRPPSSSGKASGSDTCPFGRMKCKIFLLASK